ncbi:hypothetical protein D3C72_1827900 [compost metagenome]
MALYLERKPVFRIRPTEDADAVVACVNHREYVALQTELGQVGVRHLDDDSDAPMCRMRTASGHLLDLMPWDPTVLGFGNRWFRQGYESAITQSVGNGLDIRIFTPPLYAAAKAEAFRDRGWDDPWSSHDLEDFLTLVACRPSLLTEISGVDDELRGYLSTFAAELLKLPRFDEMVSGHVGELAERTMASLEKLATY